MGLGKIVLSVVLFALAAVLLFTLSSESSDESDAETTDILLGSPMVNPVPIEQVQAVIDSYVVPVPMPVDEEDALVAPLPQPVEVIVLGDLMMFLDLGESDCEDEIQEPPMEVPEEFVHSLPPENKELVLHMHLSYESMLNLSLLSSEMTAYLPNKDDDDAEDDDAADECCDIEDIFHVTESDTPEQSLPYRQGTIQIFKPITFIDHLHVLDENTAGAAVGPIYRIELQHAMRCQTIR